ncbi:MAG: hypothetical protein U1E29_12210 [Coriobacteriia bacterium]|nr:hypothetical protein [Coriobacteriia bacterium]
MIRQRRDTLGGIALLRSGERSRRQCVRTALLLLSFIAFPVTINYFSPYLIVEGAFSGVATGSLVVFGSMFAGSLVFGRLWWDGCARPPACRNH